MSKEALPLAQTILAVNEMTATDEEQRLVLRSLLFHIDRMQKTIKHQRDQLNLLHRGSSPPAGTPNNPEREG
jgi:Mg2+ and Co2+ transporter CorA